MLRDLLPVVRFRRTVRYQQLDLDDLRFCAMQALDALESQGEDGINRARSWLYAVVSRS